MSDKLDSYEELYLPGTALAELYYGAFKSDRAPRHLDQIAEFLTSAEILMADEETSMNYGKIAAKLAVAGTPIPQNDIWMAALSVQSGLPLATMDRHFEHVEGLNVLFW